MGPIEKFPGQGLRETSDFITRIQKVPCNQEPGGANTRWIGISFSRTIYGDSYLDWSITPITGIHWQMAQMAYGFMHMEIRHTTYRMVSLRYR